MNSQNLKSKRRLSQTDGERPVLGSSTSHTPFAELTYNSLPPDLQSQLQLLATAYGITGPEIHCFAQHKSFLKKRKLNSGGSMAPHHITPPAQECLEKHLITEAQDLHGHHQSQAGSRWPEPSPSTTTPSSVPFVRRVAEDFRRFLCPGCGLGIKQTDEGYLRIPEASPVVYGPAEPYAEEEPPSMQASSYKTYQHDIPNGPPVHAFNPVDQAQFSSAPVRDYSLVPAQVPLTNQVDVSGQPDPPPSYYGTNWLKQEGEAPRQSVYANPSWPSNSSSHLYSSDLLCYPAPPLLPQTGVPAAPEASNYSLISTGPFDSTTPENRWREVSLQDQQPCFDIILPNQRGGKRGPFRNQDDREQTARTRKRGSCIRCRMQRIRCQENDGDLDGPCKTCTKVANSRAGRFPCLRYKIADVRLYKPGQVPGYEWTRRWNNNISDPIKQWDGDDVKTICISAGLCNKYVEVQVRRFKPQEGDKLERTWVHNGKKRSVVIPPYALVNLDAGKNAYSKHILDSMDETLDSLLRSRGAFLYATYQKAWSMWKDPSTTKECKDLLGGTLELWMAIRHSTRSGFIVGDETLGMPRDILDHTNPNHGMIPLPPVLGAQLDVILIHHIQTGLRRELLDKLQKMITRNKQNTWLVMYLVIFILLHNTSLITAHDASYARKHGMKRRFARIDKVKEYHLGANILLAYFHYCNKGIYPFSKECKDQELRNLAELDDEQIQFVRKTRGHIRDQKQKWKDVRTQGAYENDYFFVSQLFEENWLPCATI